MLCYFFRISYQNKTPHKNVSNHENLVKTWWAKVLVWLSIKRFGMFRDCALYKIWRKKNVCFTWTSFIFAWSSSVVLSGFSSNQLRTSSQYVLTEGTFSPIWLIVWYSTLSNWFLASTRSRFAWSSALNFSASLTIRSISSEESRPFCCSIRID